ncbi:adenylate/guanylate cyclase domain-containing protein [Leptospira mtsangambouensis]|uniref:adenylate/guanylate cyclase domain-containing protein n=1 Tax=Leptospira mtsangambouensis TaxID=2484912 RepID=UPI001EEC63D2|nr:adenylate/guanylate cyclase domain-containing protein [Leptospira mtsangambouensis]MCG6142800.1 adenylate/guanylate cyclase domain-containing protein [Leptospira mtsangambouensis]
MGLSDDLITEVDKIFKSTWTIREGTKVPEPEDIKLGNDGVKIQATVLYADLDGSTNLVDSMTPQFAAEIYKTYLFSAAKIIKSEGGTITAYDGDRIMAIYIGDSKNTSAVRSALKINYSVLKIINPAIKKHYPSKDYEIKQVVGIDSSPLMAARTGVRGYNDIVWVGRSANYAAKLSSYSSAYSTRITKTVYDKLSSEAKYSDGKDMWEKDPNLLKGQTIYRSTYFWTIK